MKKFRIFERIRKSSPDPLKFLRLNRAEFGSTFKKLNYDFDNYYPNIDPLIEATSQFYKVKKNQIFIGSGGESIIKDIFLLMFLKRKKTIFYNPTNFFMYNYYSDLFNFKKFKYIINPSEKTQNVDNFIKSISKNKKIDFLVIVNPSHPFEHFWKKKEIEKILKFTKKKQITVLLDEVYLAYQNLSVINLINKFDHLIVLKSLSKIPGLPGLRVGFAFSNKKIVDELSTTRLAIELPEYNVRKATKYISNPNKFINNRLRMINLARSFAHKEFSKRNVQSFGEYGNSVSAYINNASKIKKIGDYMMKNKIMINYKYSPPFDKYINITTTNRQNIQFFFKIFDKIKF